MRALIPLVLVACATPTEQPDAGTLAPFEYARCADDARVGAFAVQVFPEYTRVVGQVFDGVLSTNVLDTLAEEGTCRLVKAPPTSCVDACGNGQVCGVDGCETPPSAIGIGTVTLSGFDEEVSLQPLPPTNLYNHSGTGFTPEADLALAADGLALRGWGITAIEVPDEEVVVESGEPLVVTWTALSEPGPAKVLVNVNMDTHGVNGSHIECEVDDNGLFLVPATLIDMLLGSNLSGFPTVTVSRATIDAADFGAGCVELRVESSVVRALVVPGVTSCTEDTDCTAPETCQSDLTCG